MNALSKLLTKVAKRVLRNNPSNSDILETADRVVVWSSANYITEEQVEEIASAVPEPVEETPVEAPAENESDVEPDVLVESAEE